MQRFDRNSTSTKRPLVRGASVCERLFAGDPSLRRPSLMHVYPTLYSWVYHSSAGSMRDSLSLCPISLFKKEFKRAQGIFQEDGLALAANYSVLNFQGPYREWKKVWWNEFDDTSPSAFHRSGWWICQQQPNDRRHSMARRSLQTTARQTSDLLPARRHTPRESLRHAQRSNDGWSMSNWFSDLSDWTGEFVRDTDWSIGRSLADCCRIALTCLEVPITAMHGTISAVRDSTSTFSMCSKIDWNLNSNSIKFWIVRGEHEIRLL